MNVVFLSPHFPRQYHLFCAGLRSLGARALGIGDANLSELPPPFREALTEYYRVEDLHDYDGLVRACGYFTHRYGKIDRFESHNEYWLDTDARIRDDFNIFGLRSADIRRTRRKSGMKAVFREAGLTTAPGRIATTLEDATALAEEAGYPLIAKPDAGVGALDTFRIENPDELQRFFDAKPAAPYFLEAFVRGELYSFDGMTDANGGIVFETAHFFSQGIMETVNEGRHIHYYNLMDVPPALRDAGRACVRAFGIRERFFHIEFFKTGTTEYIPLEVNLRPPGGFTTDMFNYAADADVYRSWAEVVVQGGTAMAYRPRYHCCYASRKVHIPYAIGEEEIRRRFAEHLVAVETVPGVFRSALGDTGFLFRSPDMDVIHTVVEAIHRTEA